MRVAPDGTVRGAAQWASWFLMLLDAPASCRAPPRPQLGERARQARGAREPEELVAGDPDEPRRGEGDHGGGARRARDSGALAEHLARVDPAELDDRVVALDHDGQLARDRRV